MDNNPYDTLNYYDTLPKMNINHYETITLTKKNEDAPVLNKKSFFRYYIPKIIIFLLVICGMTAQVWIVVGQINQSKYELITTIKNNTNIVLESKPITNGTNKLLSGLPSDKMSRRSIGNRFPMINRAKWGAVNSTRQLNRLNGPIGMVIIAHTDSKLCDDFDTCKYQINILQQFYIRYCNFEDIGYNFLIGGDGAVYEGIGWDYIGNHTKDHNDNSIGIGFIGNYQNNIPTEQQLSAATSLLNYGLENNYLDTNYVIKGQRDFLPIVSPGNNLYNCIKKWDHFYKTGLSFDTSSP